MCLRSVEEYQEKYYQYNGYQGNNNQNNYNQNQQQAQQQNYYQNQGQQQYYQGGQQYDANEYNNYNNYNNNGGQQQEYFIGPMCSGNGKVTLGVFYNEWCTYPADNLSVKDVLGYKPSNNFNMQTCISCTNQYNYNNNGEAEINPLCERLLERSGRCDRNEKQQTDFDAFWADVVEFVNGGGSFAQYGGDGYDEYYEGEQQQDQQADGYYEDNRNWYQGQQNYYGGQQQDMNYYQYNSQNTCDTIDSLPHMQSRGGNGGNWYRMKEEANNNGLSTGALIVIIFGALAAACLAGFMIFGWFARKSVEAVGSVASMAAGESETPYVRETEKAGAPAVLA